MFSNFVIFSLSLSLSLSVLMAIFQVNLVSRCLLKQRMVEVVVQNSNQIITTNKPTPSLFLQTRCPSCHPTNSVKALNGKKSHSMDLLTQSSPGGLLTLSLTINSSWLSWGRVAMPLINPLMPVPINKIHNYHRMENKVVNTVLKHFSNIRTEQSIFQNTPG